MQSKRYVMPGEVDQAAADAAPPPPPPRKCVSANEPHGPGSLGVKCHVCAAVGVEMIDVHEGWRKHAVRICFVKHGCRAATSALPTGPGASMTMAGSLSRSSLNNRYAAVPGVMSSASTATPGDRPSLSLTTSFAASLNIGAPSPASRLRPSTFVPRPEALASEERKLSRSPSRASNSPRGSPRAEQSPFHGVGQASFAYKGEQNTAHTVPVGPPVLQPAPVASPAAAAVLKPEQAQPAFFQPAWRPAHADASAPAAEEVVAATDEHGQAGRAAAGAAQSDWPDATAQMVGAMADAGADGNMVGPGAAGAADVAWQSCEGVQSQIQHDPYLDHATFQQHDDFEHQLTDQQRSAATNGAATAESAAQSGPLQNMRQGHVTETVHADNGSHESRKTEHGQNSVTGYEPAAGTTDEQGHGEHCTFHADSHCTRRQQLCNSCCVVT